MKRVLLVTAALVAAVAVFTLLSLPPAPARLDTSWSDGTVAGAVHIHTLQSDGSGTPDEIAAAAARAGLAFVVFTDHGDAARAPDPPVYRSGVLCLDAVEISTSGGHVVALDLPKAPYPLGGEPRDVVEDIHRLGGMAIAAHPDSPKDELSWTDWAVPVDGIEVINPDTAWRVQFSERGIGGKWRLLRALSTYPWRPGPTIAGLLTSSSDAVQHWQALAATRRVVGIAGSDAHAKISLRTTAPGDNRLSLAIPDYESSFRSLSIHIRPSEPLTGDPSADSRRVLDAIRGGHLYSAVNGWAQPPAFEFSVTSPAGIARAGDEIEASGPASVQVKSNAPQDFVTTVWKNDGAIARDQHGPLLTIPGDDAPGAYRVEIRSAGHVDGPAWIISNPVYVRAPRVAPARTTATTTSPGRVVASRQSLFDGKTTIGWTQENDSSSAVGLEIVPQGTGGNALRVRYGLSGGDDRGQFAGAAVDALQGVANFDRVVFTARAEHAMRISVQVRAQVEGKAPERWQRSVYLDETDQERDVRFSDMMAVGPTSTERAPAAAVRSILFIVDTLNSKPGASGRIWLRNLRLENIK